MHLTIVRALGALAALALLGPVTSCTGGQARPPSDQLVAPYTVHCAKRDTTGRRVADDAQREIGKRTPLLGFGPYLPGEDRLVPVPGSTFDAATVETEILAFEAAAIAMHRDADVTRVEFGTEAEVAYHVLPDGRWHVSEHQLYLIMMGEPHLTPQEWVERRTM